MKNIVLTRIDDRLIHGQVVTAWIKQYPINKILIIDDELSQNRLMERIYKAAAPMGVLRLSYQDEVHLQSGFPSHGLSEGGADTVGFRSPGIPEGGAGKGGEFSDSCKGSGNHRVASQRGD